MRTAPLLLLSLFLSWGVLEIRGADSPSSSLDAGPVFARQRTKKFLPNDPLFPRQWHLRNTGEGTAVAGIDLHLANTWERFTGKGVVIAIVDDGLDTTHPDLAQHINPALGYDWNGGDTDPTADPDNGDFHGTACAGAAAAVGNNGVGVSGVAFEATLAGLRLIAGESTDETESASMLFHNQEIDIKNNSWGPADDGQTLEAPGPLTLAALEESAHSGRGGKGTIFVWPGGNGLDAGDNANYDGFANSIYTIAVTGVTDQGLQTDYGEPGACLVVAIPSGSLNRSLVVTTDLQGIGGLNRAGPPGDLADLNYTDSFDGTSAATAIASGAIALVLQANPNLGWRDVQEILIRSARKNDDRDGDWDENAAGFHFNHKFGAGLIDVDAAVALALQWRNLGAQTHAGSAKSALNRSIPDRDPNGVALSFDMTRTHLRVEHATLTVNISHPHRGNLAITLVSPSGVESRLAENHSDPGADYPDWKFMSVRHWGESSQGIWTVKVADLVDGDVGVINSVALELFGTDTGAPNSLLLESAVPSDAAGGNGNGGIEPGETISETLSFHNVAIHPITGSAHLLSRTEGVEVLQAETTLPMIAPGSVGLGMRPFSYRLTRDIPCGTVLLFDVVVESGGLAWTNTFRHRIGSPPVPWRLETVDSVGTVGSFTSIALDAKDQAHISYYDTGNGDLKHASQKGTNWVVETVDSAGNVGMYTSLRLDDSGRPRICYRDSTLKHLKYAAWDGAAWQIETVYSEGASGSFASLALDNNGNPLIAFQDETNGDLLLARKRGVVWNVERVDTEGITGSDISLALGLNGDPMISYRNVTLNDLRFAEWNGLLWEIVTIDSEGSVGYNTSLKVGRDGSPRIAYRDTTNARLKYARRAIGGWRTEVVDGSGSVGFDCSLALDVEDRPRISYRDIGNNDLKFASWNGAFWDISLVDADGSVGAYTSLALNGFDHPRICYRDTSNGDLKFAALDQFACLVFSPEVGPALSIALNPAGLRLSWPAASQGFILESCDDLVSANWTPVVGTASTEGDSFFLLVPTGPKERFYRLKRD